jgi:hypothetical protein
LTTQLFRLSGAVHHDPAIDAWLSEPAEELRRIAQTWFEHMRGCGADVRELMHDGCPVACVEDAPFGYVNTFRDHVNVGFFHGATLGDPAGLLQGAGKRMRHVKLRWGEPVNEAAMTDLIAAAYRDIRLRLKTAS